LIEGGLTSVGLLLLYVSFRLPPMPWRKLTRAACVLAAMVCIWFAAVDWARHIGWCEHCGSYKVTQTFRFYRMPLWPYQHVHEDDAALIAADLGTPCIHEFQPRLWIKAWGLLYLSPRAAGTLSLSNGPYSDIQPYVRAMAVENPELGEEFRQKVFVEQDQQYYRQFMDEIYARQERAEPAENDAAGKP
jgi:hypothetical protein